MLPYLCRLYESLRAAILPLLLILLLSGCVRLPIAGPDAARITATAVSQLDAEALFAADPGGKQVAFSQDGVAIAPLPVGEAHCISSERPLALVWSPDGTRLAVAFARGTASRIIVFGADGIPAVETTAAGRVGTLFWPASDTLLAVALELEHYRFGISCREVLLRWNLSGNPARTVLHETTLRSFAGRTWREDAMLRAVSPALSPQGDELVYGRIQDPPAFDTYLKMMVRNLSSGDEREVAKSVFPDGGARFSADGDELFLRTESGRINRIDAWNGAEKQSVPFSGRLPVVSPDGHHLLVEGRLLDDGREVALFPPRATGNFLDDGRLLLVDNGTLFLVSGFETSVVRAVPSPEKQERLRTIRTWRASGLISAEDYVTAKEKVMK